MSNNPKKTDNDLTIGPIGPKLWSLAWPMMLSVFFYTLYNIVDAYWVSKLSSEAIAAVSISQITLFLMISLGFGITIGSGVVMAMDIGAKNKPAAERVLGQSFVLMSMAGLFFSIVAILFRTQLLTLSGASGDIFEPALTYFTITSGGSILFFLLIAIMFAFNAQGDTLTLTKLFAFSTLINLVMDPILIFGWGLFPASGIAGAAYSTLISQAAFIAIALYSLSRPERQIQFHWKNLSFQWASVKKVMKIGLPASLTQIINPIGLAALTYISSRSFAEPGAIAFSLGFRIEFFAYLPAIGYGFATMSMMGQSIGAENLDRAKDVLRTALKYSFFIALGLGLVVVVFAHQIIGIFTTDAIVTAYALQYMRSVAFSYCFLAAMMVEANAFQAVGKSWPGFWILFIRFGVISIPLSFILTEFFGFPILSIWLAVMTGNIIASIIGYFWIWRTLNTFNFKNVEEIVHEGMHI